MARILTADEHIKFPMSDVADACPLKPALRPVVLGGAQGHHTCTIHKLQLNVQRLKEYKSKLIVFPRNRAKPKAGDSEPAALETAEQLKGALLPMPTVAKGPATMAITQEMKDEEAFHKIRMARADFRLFGVRQKNRLAKAAKD